MSAVLILATAVLLLAIARAALNYWHAVAAARLVQQQIVVELRSTLYEKLHELGGRFFRDNSTTSIINRVTSDAQSVRQFVEGMVLQLVILVLSLAVYLAYMLRIHLRLSLVCLATMPILWLIATAFCRAVRPAYDRNRRLMDRLLQVLTENLRTPSGPRICPGAGRNRQVPQRRPRGQGCAVLIFLRVSTFTPTTELLSSLNLAALLAYGGYLVIIGELPLGTGLIVFSGLLQQFSGQITKMVNVLNSMQQSLAGTGGCSKSSIRRPKSPRRREAGDWPRRTARSSFSGCRSVIAPVIRCSKMSICGSVPASTVAILGATGASTLLQLIPRFVDPTAGRVLIDGIDARA